jgi:hypothetical protein
MEYCEQDRDGIDRHDHCARDALRGSNRAIVAAGTMSDYAAAVHEAGHIAITLGLPVSGVELNGDGTGHATGRHPRTGIMASRDWIVVSAAGSEAERQLCGLCDGAGREDLELQRQKAIEAGLSDADVLWARLTAASLAETSLPAIARIANELVRRRRLTGAEIDQERASLTDLDPGGRLG